MLRLNPIQIILSPTLKILSRLGELAIIGLIFDTLKYKYQFKGKKEQQKIFMEKTEMKMFKNSKVKLMSETTGNAQYWQLCLSWFLVSINYLILAGIWLARFAFFSCLKDSWKRCCNFDKLICDWVNKTYLMCMQVISTVSRNRILWSLIASIFLKTFIH